MICTQNEEVQRQLVPYFKRMHLPKSYYLCTFECQDNTCKFLIDFEEVKFRFEENFLYTDAGMAAWDHNPVRPDGTLKGFRIEFRPDRLKQDNFKLMGVWNQMLERQPLHPAQPGEYKTVWEEEKGKYILSTSTILQRVEWSQATWSQSRWMQTV